MIPTIGRIVYAVFMNNHGQAVTRPAIVVHVWGTTADAALNAQVFTDGNGTPSNDGTQNVIWKTSLAHDPEGKALNSWHWPKRD